MIFFPSVLKINLGDKVRFIPSNKGHFPMSVFTPGQTKPWKGEVNKKKELLLSEEGIYIYKCGNHGPMGMVGMIQVGKSKNFKEAKEFIKGFREKLFLNKGRIDEYFLKIQND